MAKKDLLTYKEIEDRLRILREKEVPKEDIGYVLLYSFGKGERELERFREGKGIIKTFDGLLIKGLLCYKSGTTLQFANLLDDLKHDQQVLKACPKIIAVSDGKTIRAFDLRQKETFEQKVDRLYCDFEFFYPLAGVERIEYVEESPADIKAAEKLAKLHDEIRAYNEFTSETDLHDLNTFIARLLFCFFAEDTGIFPSGAFTHAIQQFTSDSRNLKDVLEQLFRYMGGKPIPSGMLQTYCRNNFAYVGGGLFERGIYIPELSNKARQIIIESGELDWQNINPDIFGSMIQAVVNPDVRANQGMHYTSVPNIMKVINPLFLDELRTSYTVVAEEFDRLKKQKDICAVTSTQFVNACKPIEKKCHQLLLRISKMKFFDPACGSGNFLIITYKMLRLLEMDILALIAKCTKQTTAQFIDGSIISLQQFYGIELLDFPHEVAMLSLWLAEHQMNKKMREDFGVNTNALPLKDIKNIRCGNACRIDWNEVCPHTKDEEVFLFGNPPYLGFRMQRDEQKADMDNTFSGVFPSYRKLDYISQWFYNGAEFIKGYTHCECAFVSTNSVSQGEHISLLWGQILGDIQIAFAYTSFKWVNNAKYNAAVICVIIGLSNKNSKKKVLYTEDKKVYLDEISPSLSETKTLIVKKCNYNISGFPNIRLGNMPNDNKILRLTPAEAKEIINEYPEAKPLIKLFKGSAELINSVERYCLWISDKDVTLASSIPPIKERIDKVYNYRINADDVNLNLQAERPYQFREFVPSSEQTLVIPIVSSAARDFIPIAFVDSGTVVPNSAFMINDAPIEIFAIITSHLHMVWIGKTAGRMKSDFRYSTKLCYNTFPFPHITSAKKQDIEEAATEVLMAREPYLTMGKTLADLYDPDKMPDDLREAHHKLDDIVESCYPGYPFTSDEARLECLFKMYEKMTKK